MVQRGRPPAIARLTKLNQHWTPEQLAWLQARAQALGNVPVSSVARMVVQAAMDAERQQQEATA